MDEWAAMSWHQRQKFVQVRRVPFKARVLIPCEKAHVEDLPPAPEVQPWDEVRMHHEMVLMRRRAAARLAAEVVTPAEGDRNWNELAEAIGNEVNKRYVW
ncbi:hypothetical protein [Arthrobacter sp. SDTb3-6]|uniref:hypothetical protein n=1 Tax=Arthrobacter sp. SDTb3-6 TaxID=2713571 RepID=UPI00159E4026|nr:hypothetical protein [Arthrobacter sp. SDTb3-6]NVM97815.1 hypothetical protein [Arthrobacter sp. SDTb3-6]